MDTSEKWECYVFGQCEEYSVNFEEISSAESCHKFCGKNDDCKWWTWEHDNSLCSLFANCTDPKQSTGHPDAGACPDCISGQQACPGRECHSPNKCQGHVVEGPPSKKATHLEDCINICKDTVDCEWYTYDKKNDHCLLFKDCNSLISCDTCATGKKYCSNGYHGDDEEVTEGVAQASTEAVSIEGHDKVIAAKEAEKEDAEGNEISDEPVEKFSKTEINGKFKIMGEWDEKLSDPESEEFKSYSETITRGIEEMLAQDETLTEQADFTVSIVGFRQGSVICNFKVNYILKEGFVAVPITITPANVTTSLEKGFDNQQGVLFQRFPIAAGSFKAAKSSDTICKGPGPRSGCNDDEFCGLDGVQDKDLVFKCAKKVAVGEYCKDDSWCSGGNGICRGKRCVNKLASGETGCKDDSWCQNGDDEHPGVCKDGTCRIWKNQGDCCNPNEADHGCDPTTSDYTDRLECNSNMWQCMPSIIYGDYDEAMRKERCMAELLG